MPKFIKPFVYSVHGVHDSNNGVVCNSVSPKVNAEVLISIDIIGFLLPESKSSTNIYSKGYVHHDGGNDYFHGTFWHVQGSVEEINKMIESAV